MDRPDVDFIEGCRRRSPSIEDYLTQPRSTVGVTGSTTTCVCCGPHRGLLPQTGADRQTPQQIVDRILELEEGTRFQILAPVVRGRKGEFEGLLKDLAKQGFARARIDGEVRELTEDIKLDRYYQHTIEVIVDRLVRREGIEQRLTQSLETALSLADGVADVEITEGQR